MDSSSTGPLASRPFTMADQERFAALSHDCNPMHMDPLAARRTQYGQPVVHGMHAALWALDVLLAARPGLRPAGLQLRFSKPMLVGDTVSLAITEDKPAAVTVEGSVAGLPCLVLRLTEVAPRGVPAAPETLPAVQPLRSAPLALALEEMPGRTGAFHYPGAPLAEAFPAAATALGAGVVAGLAAASYVVGMECPGLHSIFGSVTATLGGPQPDSPVGYAVTKCDPRFRMVEVALHGPGLAAKLGAFARMPPVRQPGMAALAALLRPGEFAGQRALVVGGSRGIGEVTAKLLAAGGAEVALTYAAGADDAERVAAEIRAAGGSAEVLRHDVRAPAAPQLAALRMVPNALYYCATGPVFRRKLAFWEPALMREFLDFYVEGFQDLALALHQAAGKLVAFYPSSVAAGTPVRDLAEYSAAKLAGEAVAAHLQAFHEGLRVLVHRLPRTNTDLTASVAAVEAAEPAEVMLPILREVQAALG